MVGPYPPNLRPHHRAPHRAAAASAPIAPSSEARSSVNDPAFAELIHYYQDQLITAMQGAYLRTVMRGEMRRHLDGSAAGVPDEAARQYAQRYWTGGRRSKRQKRARPRMLASRYRMSDLSADAGRADTLPCRPSFP